MDIDQYEKAQGIPTGATPADQGRTNGLTGSIGYTDKPYSCASAIDEKIGWHLDQINRLRDVKKAVEGMGWLPDAIHHQIARSMYP